jgi:hypothetical protein
LSLWSKRTARARRNIARRVPRLSGPANLFYRVPFSEPFEARQYGRSSPLPVVTR